MNQNSQNLITTPKKLQQLPITHDLSPSKESNRSCILVDVNQRKAVGIMFNSDNISWQHNQVIESFIR